MSRMNGRIPTPAELDLDPLADMVLPLLLAVSAGLAVSVTARGLEAATGLRLLFVAGPAAFLFALESCLFTTIFDERDLDTPRALRWIEVLLMAVLAKVLAAWPVTHGPIAALLEQMNHGETWLDLALLGWAWFHGWKTAKLITPLHPRQLQGADDQERVVTDNHGPAFADLSALVLGEVAAVAALTGILGWVRGDVGLWTWNWSLFLLLLLAVAGLAAVLIAAQLRQRMTWGLEGLTVPPVILSRWVPQGLALFLLPVVLALLLPAGPRLPVERLVNRVPAPPTRMVRPPEQPKQPEGLEMPAWAKAVLDKEPGHPLQIPRWPFELAGLALLAYLLRVALRQWLERVDRRKLKGVWMVLAAVAGWYLGVWKALGEWGGSALRQAAGTTAAAARAALAETGVLGRYLPVRRRPPAEGRAAVRFYFARLQEEAGRRGLKRRPENTAAEFTARLAEQAPGQQPDLARLTAIYEEARYGTRAITPDHVSVVRQVWVTISRSLRRK